MSTNEASGFHHVLAEEMEHITSRRIKAMGLAVDDTLIEPPLEVAAPTSAPPPPIERSLVGLAFSGGGIRSATFGLGFIQGLADLGLLRRFDYLSTVSGGGYIGSWLASWIKREGSVGNVEQQLKTRRADQALAKRGVNQPAAAAAAPKTDGESDKEPEPIYHLRAYSNYLAPRVSFLSADSWTLLAIYLRNLLLNLTVLLPSVTAVLLAARCFVVFYECPRGRLASESWTLWLGWGMLGLLLAAFISIARSFFGLHRVRQMRPGDSPGWRMTPLGLHTQVLAPALGAAILICWLFTPNEMGVVRWTAWGVLERGGFGTFNWWSTFLFALIFAGLHATGHIPSAVARVRTIWRRILKFRQARAEAREPQSDHLEMIRRERKARAVHRSVWQAVWEAMWTFLSGILSGGLLGALLYVVLVQVLWPLQAYPAAIATIGPPLVLLVFMIAAITEVGLVGRYAGEDEREWWGRLCAWLVIYAVVWFVVFGISVFGTMLLRWADWGVRAALAAGWVTTAIAGVWAGWSASTGTPRSSRVLELIGVLGPPVFIVGLLALLTMLVDALVEVRPALALAQRASAAAPIPNPVEPDPNAPPSQADASPAGAAADSTVPSLWSSYVSSAKQYLHALRHTNRTKLIGWLVASILLAHFASRCVDVNEFSMHAMYANRLVRCYLGASRPKDPGDAGGAVTNSKGWTRLPDLVTGFDPRDDFALHELQIGRIQQGDDRSQRYWGPFPLINTAMNLVAGKELAWQERKAESFLLSPLYCGSASTKYRKLPEYGDDLSLGTAVAISGAAASPNMGYHTAPALAALMTVFNVRLGWWLGNPARAKWRNAGPRNGHTYLITELLSLSSAERSYVYLSDGGHFENLGVYELVRRQCRYIVVCDAGADPDLAFEDLGNLVRKCRTDLGVDIEINLDQLRRQVANQSSSWHCAVGTIRYDHVNPRAPVGTLVYVKPTLTGDEPADIQHYAKANADFPHRSTLDQFFNESEFEGYRALGHHSAQAVFAQAAPEFIATYHPGAAPQNVTRDKLAQVAEREHIRAADDLFAMLRKQWFAPPPGLETSFLESTGPFIELQQHMGSDANLQNLGLQLYPELETGYGGPRAAAGAPVPPAAAPLHWDPVRRAEFHAVSHMLQIMENVWLGMRLENYHAHPLNRGWMNVFHRWSNTALVRNYWPILRGEYSQGFVEFCERELNLGVAYIGPSCDLVQPGDAIWSEMAEEFDLEWPEEADRQRDLRAHLFAATQLIGFSDPNVPPIWTIAVTPIGSDPAQRHICGLALLRPADKYVQDPTPGAASHHEYEFMIWLRGTYRKLGIGDKLINDLLPKILGRLRRQHGKDRVTLLACYPQAAWERAGGKIEKRLWLSFFYAHGFRKRTAQAPVQPNSYVVLERPVTT